MLRFDAIGRDALGRWVLGAGGSGTGESGSGEAIPTPVVGADITWPFDDLKPRDIGIYPCASPIGGGIALTGKEPVIDSGVGYWRIVLGAIPVKNRTNILIWRSLEAQAEGRGRTFAIPIYDGKRAPWPDIPGGAIDAESVSDVQAGATTIQIFPIDIGDISVGMHFSVADRLYRITRVDGESSLFDCQIWPSVREAFPAGMTLEFRRPLCRVRLASDDGMSLELDQHKRAEATVEFVEAI
jgi:hypothetical protein